MKKRFQRYLDEMTLSPHGVWVAGKKGSDDLDSHMEVAREYLSDADKSYWKGNISDAIKALDTLQKKVLRDIIEILKSEQK